MSTSTRKIVAGLLSFAMVLTLVVGLSTTASAAISRDLTVGSRGTDVTELQAALAEAGYLNVAPTGYFGTLTKRALSAWQAANGVSPASGYFGPKTRAAWTGGTVVTPVTPGCSAGAMYNSATGQPCGGTVSTPGCSAGAIYNSITGAACTTGGGTLGNTEGTLEVNQAATPANNANIQTSIDVPVYGLNLRARLGDVRVDRVDLEVSVLNSTSAENPGNFVNTIKAWDGSTLVKSWAVGTTDFIKDSSNVYYIRLSNLGLIVPKDGQKNIVFSFSTNGGIDNDRSITVSGYGANSLLTTSGNNVVSYYNIDTLSRSHTFKKPGIATLTLQGDANNPLSQNYKVDSSNGSGEVVLETFAVRAADGDVKVTGVTLTSSSSATVASTIFLYDGSTLVDSRTNATSTTFSFSNQPVTVSKDSTKTFTVKASFPNNTTSGTVASTTVRTVSYDKPNGTSDTATGTIAGNNHTFYASVPVITALSPMTATREQNSTTGTTSLITGNLTFKVRPVGGSMTLPTASSFVVKVGTTTSALSTVNSSSVSLTVTNPVTGQILTSGQTLAEGVEYTFTLTATVANSTLTYSGYYSFYVTSFAWTVGSVSQTQTTGLDALQTGSIYFSK